MKTNGFPKRERIAATRQVATLFGSGSHTAVAYPLRAVYRLMPPSPTAVPVQVLLSVPKKRLRHAVDRNRVKRQLREAYRCHKPQLHAAVPPGHTLLLALVWQSDHIHPTAAVAPRVEQLLRRIAATVKP